MTGFGLGRNFRLGCRTLRSARMTVFVLERNFRLRNAGGGSIWLGKMLPALRGEVPGSFGRDQGKERVSAARLEDAADLRHRNACNGTRHPSRGRGGEEEFVVLASMQGLLKGRSGVQRQGACVHFGGYAGFLAQVGQISGKPVAKVERRRSQAAALQPESLSDAGLRIKMGCQLRFQSLGDTRG